MTSSPCIHDCVGCDSWTILAPVSHRLFKYISQWLLILCIGTRGATSAEYFLDAGYAVIFMHRQFSLQPFSRHYSHSLNPFMDLLAVEEDGPGMAGAAPPAIVIVPEARTKLLSVLTAYRKAHVDGTLLTLNFVTVNDYLWLLKAVSEEMAVLKRRAMYYLAAAVSDFFLPTQKMSEHKIQSGKGTLNIEMDQVPKILKPMVDEWTPEGFVVSFKLETDSKILIPKARASLERYGHQVVIGNELNRRKFEVVFVSKAPSRSKSTITPTSTVESNSKGESPMVEEWLRLSQDEIEQGKEIESDIVERLVRLHATYIDAVKM
ncbi:hypothetical protein FRB94_006269 [Tulasnella sp. JGI-2019a]|nr:hypothetical protein FRB94_006269 [Tulasnella sp. JGI-2019a]